MQPVLDSLSAEHMAFFHKAKYTVQEIGHTVEGRPLHGILTSTSPLPLISIVAGAHPDEPAGPIAALNLLQTWQACRLAAVVRLAVVPVMDIDGIVAQRAWLSPWDGAVDLQRYLAHHQRRQPGADREFGWPGAAWSHQALPECQAADHFFHQFGPAIAHLSLHGMLAAQGAWYLLDKVAMTDGQLWRDLRANAAANDLKLHEFRRYGDKGFRRVGLGFCTTPSGPLMRRHFLQAGDLKTAARFGYGSMDAARARAATAAAPVPLCAVSEVPLLVVDAEGHGKQVLQELQMSADPAQSIKQALSSKRLQAVPMQTQVQVITEMVSAVIRAALRRNAIAY